MVTEIEHSRALNRAAFPILFRQIVPVSILSLLAFAFVKHSDMHKKANAKMFYNRSKLFGGAKNPQY